MTFKQALSNIQRKYNYNDEMMEYISKAFKALHRYYGKYGNYTKKIYNTLMETRIITYEIDENPETKTKIKEELMRLYSFKTEEDITHNTIFEEGELLWKLEGNKVVKLIIIKNSCFDFLSTLVHELIHALLTSSEVYEEDNKLYIKTGLSKEYFLLKKCSYETTEDVIEKFKSILTEQDIKDGVYNLNWMDNIQIEEGLTEYDTIMALKLINYNIEPTDAYTSYFEYVKTMMDNEYINRVVNKTRLDAIDYISQIKQKDLRDNLYSYIRNFKNICSTNDYEERKDLVQKNKELILKYIK